MLLDYKRPGVWGISCLPGQPLILVPGINKISDENWEVLKNHKAVQHKLSTNEIVVVQEKQFESEEDEKGELSNKDLSGYNRFQAVELVKNTLNIGLLREWQDSETRKSVSNAIDKKINSILEPPTDED